MLPCKEDGDTDDRILLGNKKTDFVTLSAPFQKTPHQELSRYLPLQLLSPKMSELL